MLLTGSFVLPAGSVLQPVSELSAQLRKEAGSEDGDFILSRPNSRTHSKVIDAEAASLIRQFEKPSTIAQAVARFSRGKASSPERLLEEALPLLQLLIAAGLLVEADSLDAGRIQPSLDAGNRVDGWAVVRCVQLLEDSELYQLRSPGGQVVALKIGRPGYGFVAHALAREADTLSQLDGTVSPRLIGTGEWKNRPYLLMEWCVGSDAQSACDEFRRRSDLDSRRSLLRVTGAILEAYARLHEQGVIHGDIHPRNVLVDRHQAVKIIDLGLARSVGGREQAETVQRGGVSFFFEPEFAKAALLGAWAPLSSFAGEQYGLAAMLYLLCTGSHYLNFSLEKKEMLRQIAEAPMVSFVERGLEPRPEIEGLLARALSKDAAARFPSTREFARAWRAVPIAETTAALCPEDTRLRSIREDILVKSGLGGLWMNGEPLDPPTTSLNYGSAGIACAHYRMACASDDAELLARADVWSARAVREIGDEGAFYNKDLEISPETVGRTSLYHSPAGVYAVQALIAQARGDVELQCGATQEFIKISRESCPLLDLTLGRAGTLLGCVFLLDAFGERNSMTALTEERNRLRVFGHELFEELWRNIDGCAPIRESRELSNLGVAHGWAGLLYSTLCWCAAADEPLPRSLPDRLHQLGECAEPLSRGVQWKWDLAKPENGSMPGWCNGSAGYVFLWTAAHKALCERKYLDLAEGAAWHVWETQSSIGTLCCGMAGQAYALLNLYRHTGEKVWISRAHDLASWAAAVTTEAHARTERPGLEFRPASLYKGKVGLAVLDIDLKRPEQASMPMFEREV